MSIYYGRTHKRYTLGECLYSGGEGAVYAINEVPDRAAKIYHKRKFAADESGDALRREQQEKLETMLAQPVEPYVNNVVMAAWPQDILFDDEGKLAGYVMPKVESEDHLCTLYPPYQRRKLYPKYNWRTAVVLAYNLALTVEHIHKSGAVIGNLNRGSIMLDQKGHVTLVGTDDATIVNNETHKVYKCGVGVPELLAPELQVPDLSAPEAVFTQQSDCFSLAVLVFELLMDRCHPFACKAGKAGSFTNDDLVVENIGNGVCPYVTGGKGEPSLGVPNVMMLPESIRALFDRTFSYDAVTAKEEDTIRRRPTAEEWKTELYKLYTMLSDREQVGICPENSGHVYLKQYGSCPWCAMKVRLGRFEDTGVEIF